MKKIVLLLFGIALVYSCSSSSDSNGNISGTTITDIDGNVYHTITNCNQTWTKTNLNVSKYRNGDIIPQVTDATQWETLTTGAWCYYNNDPANGVIYGKLYNWYAISDIRGIAPTGYHIPSDTEWTTLTNCLGGQALSGGKMKETGTIHWISPNTSADNSSDFSGLPGGYNYGNFNDIGSRGFWWSSSEFITQNESYGFYRALYFNYGATDSSYTFKTTGYSVRCIKD